jgi:hypothetical protein
VSSWIGPWELIFGLPLLFGPLVALVFYLLALQHALSRCAPQNRTMAPGLVWLGIIPFFGFIWQFFLAVALGKSLGTELRIRNMPAPARPGQSLGIATGAVSCAATVFYVLAMVASATGLSQGPSMFDSNPLATASGWLCAALSLAAIVLGIVYWVQIHGFSSRLVIQVPQWTWPYGPPPYGSGPYGAPPYAQPPYAQPPYGPPQSGQPPYGPPPAGGPGQPAGPSGDYCGSCGGLAPGTAFCPHCGQPR